MAEMDDLQAAFERLVSAFNDQGSAVRGRRILLLGMAYKKNTGDARESPSEKIAAALLEMGAVVSAAEPHVDPDQILDGIALVYCTADQLQAADAVVLLVDHDEFDLDLVVAEATYVFDTKCAVSGENVEHL